MSSQLRNDPLKVALASMVGTAIEFFDYYIYAAAAVLVFNTQFFHSGDPLSDDLLSLSTLALAFFARPIGSALFGHFGDKIGRKKTLVASLVNGRIDGRYRLVADLFSNWYLGTDFVMYLPSRSGYRPWW